MSRGWAIARRVAWAFLVVYLVVSMTWAFVAFTPDPNRALATFGAAASGASPEEVEAAGEAFDAARGVDRPLVERYVDSMTDIASFRWGYSFSRGAPVSSVVARSALLSFAYVLPAMVLAATCGLLIGAYTAIRPEGTVGTVVSALASAGSSIPSFLVAFVLLSFVVAPTGLLGARSPTLGVSPLAVPGRLAIATVSLALALVAGQARYVRLESLEFLQADFVRTVRATGAGPLRVLRHVLRNAVLPLLSVLVTDLLAVLLLSAYAIEVVLGLPGLGRVSYTAIQSRDVSLVLGTALVPVCFAVVASLLQDVAAVLLDPRLDD